jgi:hypothetical protein
VYQEFLLAKSVSQIPKKDILGSQTAEKPLILDERTEDEFGGCGKTHGSYQGTPSGVPQSAAFQSRLQAPHA